MSGATYFVQECPTCGRCLQVRLELLGRQVVCEHCNGEFRATDPALRGAGSNTAELLHRVDELLASVDTPISKTPEPRGLWNERRQPYFVDPDDVAYLD